MVYCSSLTADFRVNTAGVLPQLRHVRTLTELSAEYNNTTVPSAEFLLDGKWKPATASLDFIPLDSVLAMGCYFQLFPSSMLSSLAGLSCIHTQTNKHKLQTKNYNFKDLR